MSCRLGASGFLVQGGNPQGSKPTKCKASESYEKLETVDTQEKACKLGCRRG